MKFILSLVAIALAALGTPYESGTLEGEPETFRVDTTRTDCILFVEQCVAGLLCEKGLEIDPDGMRLVRVEPSDTLFPHNVRCLRYRRGRVSYPTREHYTSDWLFQAEEYGVLKEISHIKGEPVCQEFSFMSSHPSLYSALSSHPERVDSIRAVESELSGRKYFAIPKEKIAESGIESGDIICFVDLRKGLDIAHVGIALEYQGEMRFIHASSAAGRVVVSDVPIQEYAKGRIRVARISF